MPEDLAAMNVAGVASLNSTSFSMHYIITLTSNQYTAGVDFRLNGSAQARKTDLCNTQ